jgi:hypothetical protein
MESAGRAVPFALALRLLRRPRLFSSLIEGEVNKGVEPRVHPFNSDDVSFHQLHGRNLLRPDEICHLNQRAVNDLVQFGLDSFSISERNLSM